MFGHTKTNKLVIAKTKMNKTVTVLVENMSMHRLYGKRFIRSRKYHVHDDLGKKVGDRVLFVASKPFSKEIKWKTVQIGSKKSSAQVIVGDKEVIKDKSEKRSKKI